MRECNCKLTYHSGQKVASEDREQFLLFMIRFTARFYRDRWRRYEDLSDGISGLNSVSQLLCLQVAMTTTD